MSFTFYLGVGEFYRDISKFILCGWIAWLTDFVWEGRGESLFLPLLFFDECHQCRIVVYLGDNDRNLIRSGLLY